ncbi:MAG: hypothetical protein HOQ11_03930 [Gemmatimonadaceae bacterium]|nr:hypothetical protein [Gemmatimonadaceae bacterium]NUQ94719.1 hypothetical protein [Gemmatimonadaceae bacterium]NUR19183.1 hypothetical protein [Gemmatimonadaceae bacterium]NUS96540.1 hypothetical protein [Gemmatimonadaceae bacterium]
MRNSSLTLLLAACAVAACRGTDLGAPGAPRLAPSFAVVANENDALAISANIQAAHTPFGTVIDPIFASGDSTSADFTRLAGYSRAADAAIWSGHYLAAEAFRYGATGSADALANVRREVKSIQGLVDVTGTGLLARFAAPASSPYTAGIVSGEAQHGIYEGTLDGATQCWLGNTSRDQYTGVFFGLAVAYDMVPDAKLQKRIRKTVTRMLDFLLANAWNVPMPPEPVSTVCPHGTAYDVVSTTFLQRPEQRLAFLQIGRHVDPARYAAAYLAERSAFGATVSLPIETECQDPHGSYYKFNIDYANLYDLIRLEEPDSPYRLVYMNAYRTLRGCTASHQNAHSDMIDRALSGPDVSRDAEVVSLLGLWLERPRRDWFTDVSAEYPPLCDGHACEPVPVNERPNTDFLWQRSPFEVRGGKNGTIETAGIDYILPYWMGRTLGVM